MVGVVQAMWIVDTFACMTPGAVDVADIAPDVLAQMTAMNSAVSPWHAWLDRDIYARHVDSVEAFGARTVASAHGPVMHGPWLKNGYEQLRGMASAPIIPLPGQELLDMLIASTLVEATA